MNVQCFLVLSEFHNVQKLKSAAGPLEHTSIVSCETAGRASVANGGFEISLLIFIATSFQRCGRRSRRQRQHYSKVARIGNE
jgi:hypothetical protein